MVKLLAVARRLYYPVSGRRGWALRFDGSDEALNRMGWGSSEALRALGRGCSEREEENIRLARRERIAAAAGEETVCDGVERMGTRVYKGMEFWEDGGVEIVTERY